MTLLDTDRQQSFAFSEFGHHGWEKYKIVDQSRLRPAFYFSYKDVQITKLPGLTGLLERGLNFRGSAQELRKLQAELYITWD